MAIPFISAPSLQLGRNVDIEIVTRILEWNLGIPHNEQKKLNNVIGGDPLLQGAMAWLGVRVNGEDVANYAAQDKFFECTASAMEQNPRPILFAFREAMTDESGKIRQSIAESPVLGPVVKEIRKAIPPELDASIPEREMLKLAFQSLDNMIDTPEGKERTIHLVRMIGRGGNPAIFAKQKDKNGNSFLSLFTKALGERFLTDKHWEQYYHKFKANVFNKDSNGRLVLKDDVSDEIRDMMDGLKPLLPKISKDEGILMGITTGILDKNLEDPEKRKALLTLLSPKPKFQNDEEKRAWEEGRKAVYKKIIGEAAVEFAAPDSNRQLINTALEKKFIETFADPEKGPSQELQKAGKIFASHLTDLLLTKKILTGVADGLQFDTEGEVTAEGKNNVLKHIKTSILDDLQKEGKRPLNAGNGQSIPNDTRSSAYGALGTFLIHGLGFPDTGSTWNLAYDMTSPEMARLLQDVVPDDLLLDANGKPSEHNLMERFQNTELLKDFKAPRESLVEKLDTEKGQAEIAAALPVKSRHAVASWLLNSQIGLAPKYADSLARFLADTNGYVRDGRSIYQVHEDNTILLNGQRVVSCMGKTYPVDYTHTWSDNESSTHDRRFINMLKIISQCNIKDGKLTNGGELLTNAVPDMLSTDVDRRDFARAITPMIHDMLKIKENNGAVRTFESLEKYNKGRQASPFAILITHMLASKSSKDFLEQPVIGADGKKYDNISTYLAGKEMQGEIDRLQLKEGLKGEQAIQGAKGLEALKDVLKGTMSGEWESILKGMFPKDENFQNFKKTVFSDFSKAFQPVKEGGPLEKGIADIATDAVPWWNPIRTGKAFWNWATRKFSRIEDASENGTLLIETDTSAVFPKKKEEQQSQQTQTQKEQEPTKEQTGNTNGEQVSKSEPAKEATGSLSERLSQVAVAQTQKAQPIKEETGGLNGRLHQVAAVQKTEKSPTPQPTKQKGNVMTFAAAKKLADNANV